MGRGAPQSRGIGGTLPGRISLVRNVETPSGSRCRKALGRPTVRDVEVPGGTGRPRKRMPVAERRQETGTPWPALPLVVPPNWPDTGRCPDPKGC
jgi:hypothetical protein